MILVTTPTGRIGRQVLASLAAGDEPVRVIARDPQRIPDALRERVEIVVGSHRDAAVMDRAAAGVDALFWVMPAEKTAAGIYDAYVTAGIPGAEAVHRHGIPRVVIVSALGRGTGIYGGHVSASLAMEDLFRSTGAHVRALANPTFMDNLLWQLPGLREGVLSGTLPADLRLPLIATRDIAAAAVRLLTDHGWRGQDTVPLLGAEDLSANETARILGTVLGIPVVYRRGDREADKRAFVGYGYSEAIAQAMIDMDIAKERGIDLGVARTAENTTPTTLARFAAEVLAPALSA